jgi:hypothetical protein
MIKSVDHQVYPRPQHWVDKKRKGLKQPFLTAKNQAASLAVPEAA